MKKFVALFFSKSSLRARIKFNACVDKYKGLSTMEIDRTISRARVKDNPVFPRSDSKVILECTRLYGNTSSSPDHLITVTALWTDKKNGRGLSRRVHFVLIEWRTGEEVRRRTRVNFKVELVKN
jgi:hypothetical protein